MRPSRGSSLVRAGPGSRSHEAGTVTRAFHDQELITHVEFTGLSTFDGSVGVCWRIR